MENHPFMFETTNQNNSIGHPTRNCRKSSQKILTAPCLQEPISAMENILQDLSSKSIAGSAPSDFWASHPKHHEKLQCSWNSYGFMNYIIYILHIYKYIYIHMELWCLCWYPFTINAKPKAEKPHCQTAAHMSIDSWI